MPMEFVPPKRLPYEKYWKTRDFYDLEESYRIDEGLYPDTRARGRNFDTRKRVLIIYPKDIQMILGLGPVNARRMLREIQESQGLSVSGPVIITDFLRYSGLDSETVVAFMMES